MSNGQSQFCWDTVEFQTPADAVAVAFSPVKMSSSISVMLS